MNIGLRKNSNGANDLSIQVNSEDLPWMAARGHGNERLSVCLSVRMRKLVGQIGCNTRIVGVSHELVKTCILPGPEKIYIVVFQHFMVLIRTSSTSGKINRGKRSADASCIVYGGIAESYKKTFLAFTFYVVLIAESGSLSALLNEWMNCSGHACAQAEGFAALSLVLVVGMGITSTIYSHRHPIYPKVDNTNMSRLLNAPL